MTARLTFGHPMLSLLPWILNGTLAAAAVFIHYGTLYGMAHHLPQLTQIPPKYRVLLGVFVILVAHAVEIWVFALGYYLSVQLGLGNLFGMTTTSLFSDCIYLSWVSFTTIGFGDVAASGDLRFLPGLEALTGFVLITWSASFLFIEMQKFWPMAKHIAHITEARDH